MTRLYQSRYHPPANLPVSLFRFCRRYDYDHYLLRQPVYESFEVGWVARLLWLQAGMPEGGPLAFHEEARRLMGDPFDPKDEPQPPATDQ